MTTELLPATAAPAPETGTPAPAVTTPEPQATPDARTAAQRRADVRNRAHGRTAVEANTAVADQPRDAQGRFTTDAVVTPSPEPVATTTESATTPAAPAPGANRVELPADHPLRLTRGKQYLDQLEPHELSGLLNSHVRSRDLETANSNIARLEAELARERAAKDGWREQTDSVLNDPQIAMTYAELKAADPKVADQWLRGVKAEQETNVNKKLQEADTDWQAKQAEAATQRFLEHAYTDITGRLDPRLAHHPAFAAVFNEAFAHYDQLALAGVVREATADSFWKFSIKPALQAHPQLSAIAAAIGTERATARAIEAEARAKADLEAKQKAELEALQSRRAGNPLSRIPAAANAGNQLPVNGPMNAREIRENVRQRTRGVVRG